MLGELKAIDIDGKHAASYENFCSINPEFATKLRSWDKAGLVKTRIWYTPKISYRGTVLMMVGYNHDSGAGV